MWKKSTPCLIKKLQGVRQIARLKQQCLLSFSFYKTQSSYKKIMCLFFNFIGLVVKIMFLFSLHKGQQASKELKKNMNDGTIIFLTTLLIVLT